MKNQDFGLPKIDEATAEVINYIFKRLRCAVPALKYAADSEVALDGIRAEYAYALIDSGISEMEIINLGIKRVIQLEYKFLPTPGEFIRLCKEADRIKRAKLDTERQKIKNRQKVIDDEIHNKATEIWINRGNRYPLISDFAEMSEWLVAMKPVRTEVELIKKEILITKTDQ